MDLRFRDAQVTDAPDLAEICLLADGETFDFLLRGLGSDGNVKDVMAALCRSEGTAYSYRHFTVATDGERVLGGFSAIPAGDLGRLDRSLADAMEKLPGFGVFSMIRWFIRRIRLSGRSRAMEVPKNSLVLANIAVFPAHRGRGVGTALLRRVVSAASSGGFDSVCLFVWQDRPRVIDLYEREGFRISRTVRFRPHKRLPHTGRCLMELTLDSEGGPNLPAE